MKRNEQIQHDARIVSWTWSIPFRLAVTLHVNHTQGQRSFAVLELYRRHNGGQAGVITALMNSAASCGTIAFPAARSFPTLPGIP